MTRQGGGPRGGYHVEEYLLRPGRAKRIGGTNASTNQGASCGGDGESGPGESASTHATRGGALNDPPGG